MPDIEIHTSGPLFDTARAAGVMRELLADATDAVAAQAYADVMTNLNRSIRHPTPYYEVQITNQRITPEMRRVHDRGIVYGPWLEGTSRRNQTTRFKGYHSFRRALQSAQGRVPQLTQRALTRAIGRLGG